MKNEEVLCGVKIKRNILRMKAKGIGHILRSNCLPKQVIEREREMEGNTLREDDEKDVRSYWMALRLREDTGI
jgi:hypothetical protein